MAPTATLFDACRVAFIQSKHLTQERIDELSGVFTAHGGEVAKLSRQGKVNLADVTHIVSNTIDFGQYAEAQAAMIPVVQQAWITHSLHRNKPAQLRPYSPDPRLIFSSVVVTCADIPEQDKESIIGAIMAMGGMESRDLNRMTTHICALSMDHPKVEEARKRPQVKIVLPHWFDDCFRLGKRISEDPYLLPDPEILKNAVEDDVQVPSTDHLQGATSAVPDKILGADLSSSRKDSLTVFAQKKVFLAEDLPIVPRLRKILVDLIAKGDGKVVSDVEKCDTYIGQYRAGENYVRAAQTGKDVGNLAWLYHLIVQNEWTSPLQRLLHYPVPKDGIPGFKDLKIALSNYGGEARIYLENLITAAGATYTKTMKAENTHLITARMAGEKCEAAKDWNISVLNHLWIEESYSKCQIQAMTNAKYTTFPKRTNLGEVVGQVFLDETKLHEKFYPGGDDDLDSVAQKKRKINNAAQKNVFLVGQEEFASPTAPKAGRAPRANQKTVKAQEPAVTNKQKKAANDEKARAFATPAKKLRAAGKENDTPSIISTGGRSAKSEALYRLQEMAPDIALYEKEKKRAKDGHGPWGGKRAADQIDRERSAGSSSPARELPDADAAEEVKRPAKRQKSLPAVEMKVCLTGFRRWVTTGDKHKEENDRRKLRAMGIQIVGNDACDYLAAPSMIRTMKFLRALAKGPTVINSKFIDDCLDEGELLNPGDYLLKDKENEKKMGVTIKEASERARKLKGKLLWGVPIYCTADISNGYASYQAIAEANGAIFKIYGPRSGTTIKPTTAEEDGGAPPEPVYLLTSFSPAEKKLWPKFTQMAEKGNMEPRIVVTDWLLDVCMKQEMLYNEDYLATQYNQDGAK